MSGVLARSTNNTLDLRVNKNSKYGYYKYTNINSYVTFKSDSFNRYILRIFEIFESINIINKITFKSSINFSQRYIFMESTIMDFYLWAGLLKTIPNQITTSIESGKGIFSVSLIINQQSKIQQIKIKSPSYNHLYWLTKKTNNLLLADLITLIGTVDIVFGEIDRIC